MVEQQKLGSFLKEVSNWFWDDFIKAEHDPQYSTNQSIVFGLIRACVMEKLDAIRLSLNRIDGKLVTPVRIEYPKIFYLFPNAKPEPTMAGAHKDLIVIDDAPGESAEAEVILAENVEYGDSDLPSFTLRETLAAMSREPRQTPKQVIQYAQETHKWVNGEGPRPVYIPHVKSVVAAHLLAMAQNRNMGALFEVFDQIDGKLAETIKLIGEDVYIVSYSLTAPDGAYLNDDGILQIEAEAAQKIWEQKLGG